MQRFNMEDSSVKWQTIIYTFLCYPHMVYLDVSVGLIEDHLDKLRVLESVQEVGVEAVEVGLDADTLHHQVLRHPGHKLILHSLL